MRKRIRFAICLAALAAMPALAMDYGAADGPFGRWVNPDSSVMVEMRDCGGRLCGWIVWASSSAVSDAAAGGTPKLIGLELLRDYYPAGPGLWRGTVYVPDRGRAYSSRIRQLDRNHLKVTGCLWDGVICESQIWQRA